MKEKKRYVNLPPWAFLALMVVFHEGILHLWTMEAFLFSRFLSVVLLSLGFGSLLGFLVSLIPSPKWAKGVAMVLSLSMTVLWTTEYYISDAYGGFMSLGTVLGGAGGVATDFLDVVLGLIKGEWLRILLMLLPTAAYGLFCRSRSAGRPVRGSLAAAAILMYLLGGASVAWLSGDGVYRWRNGDFDMQVKAYGLQAGMLLHSFGPEQAFVVPPPISETRLQTLQEPNQAIVCGDNVLPGVDLAALAKKEGNGRVKSIYEYAASLPPARKNAYTGLFEGKNLILITAEAFTREVIDPERTPTLYRMATKGIQFRQYYQPAWGASTTSGEFSNITGLVPTNGGACMKEAIQQKLVFTMGYQLSRLGYTSIAYHNHFKDFYDRDKTHIHLGYDQFIARYSGMDTITPVWPESDLEMIDFSVPQYIDSQPFSIYYMTVSGHCPYTEKENAQTRRHIEEFQDINHSDTVKGYFASQQELELAMASLIRQLEEAGIADDTVVVLATDHYPYGLERSKTWKNTRDHLAELYGVEDYDSFLRDHNALIIWSGCLEDQDIVVADPVYSLDILPTLSNLFGVEYDSRLMVGRDVFSDAMPLVLWPDQSWITDKGSYDRKTDTFTPSGTEAVDRAYIDRVSAMAANKITFSRSVIDQDFFNKLAADIGR